MTFTEAVAQFTTQLRANPAAPRPVFLSETVDQMRESKMLQRAFDQAQMDLGLVTPSEMQRINSVVQVDPTTARRAIRYEQYV